MFQFLSSERVLLYSIFLSCIYEIHGSNKTMEVTFHLYKAGEINDTEIGASTPMCVLKRLFTKKLPTVVIIHGWTRNYQGAEVVKIRNAYLKSKNNYYVIMCNWKYLAKMGYFSSAKDTEVVGKIMGDMLLTLQSMDLCSINSNVHLVGHSLGAHVAGHCGWHIRNKTGGKFKIWKIVGRGHERELNSTYREELNEPGYPWSHKNATIELRLDPAGPGFYSLYSFKVAIQLHELSKDDAQLVIVIHTCGGLLGVYKKTGCIDVYCNGGTHPQPSCNFFDITCSHRMATDYWASSIHLPYGFFIAKMCDSKEKFEDGDCSNLTVQMGEHITEKSKCGKYYLKTTKHCPYAIEWQWKNELNYGCH